VSLWSLLLLLVARESAAVEVTLPRGVEAIAAIVDVVGPDDHATARALLVWSWAESRWDSCAIGDHGRAIGIMQVHGAVEARCDARAGYLAALRLLRVLDVACGSRLGAWRAFASGSCKGATRLVAARCAAAGGC
jgi:hypothetical protein